MVCNLTKFVENDDFIGVDESLELQMDTCINITIQDDEFSEMNEIFKVSITSEDPDVWFSQPLTTVIIYDDESKYY